MISLLIALLLCAYQSPILHLIKYVCFVISTQKANECVLFVLLFFLFTSMQAANKNWASVNSSSVVSESVTPRIAAHQASLSITNSQSLPKLMFIKSVMPSHPLILCLCHLILCRPLLLLPPIPQHQSLFQWVNSSHEVAKVLEFQLQHQSLQWTPRTDLL